MNTPQQFGVYAKKTAEFLNISIPKKEQTDNDIQEEKQTNAR